MLEITVGLAPVTKKNHPQIRYKGRKCPLCKKGSTPFVAQSESYQEYERMFMLAIPPALRLHISTPVNVRAIYYMPTLRRVDITNLHSALHDVLVAAGVLQDDSSLSPCIVAGTDGSRVLLDRQHPRTEITITALEDQEGKG